RNQAGNSASPKNNWLRFMLARKGATPPLSILTAYTDETFAENKVSNAVPLASPTACADETVSEQTFSNEASAAFSSGKMTPGWNKMGAEREGGGGGKGGVRDGGVSASKPDAVCPPKLSCPPTRPQSATGNLMPTTPVLHNQHDRQEESLLRDFRAGCKRPTWWLPPAKKSYRCMLQLRSALALEKAPPGGPGALGAFVLQDTILGGMVIPAGSKLIYVGDKTTAGMDFQAAKALAMTGGSGTELRFEKGCD
ncbi:unnamed protein product, partial [Laminaria digitata]